MYNSRTIVFPDLHKDLTDEISSMMKFFAGDTSLFSVVQNKNNLPSQLNNDLDKVSDWDYTWKMSFSPDPSKQAQEHGIIQKKSVSCSWILLLVNFDKKCSFFQK